MRYLVVLFSIIIMSLSSNAGNSDIEKAKQQLDKRGEVYLLLKNIDMSRDEINRLGKVVSIDKVMVNSIYVYANSHQFNNFLEYNIDFELLTPPSMMFESILENSRQSRDMSDFNYYPNWSEYNQIMNQFVTDYPELCELVTIGESNEGREILLIHINNDLNNDQTEPEFLYTSSIHGDELVGYVLTLRLIDYLLENYGTDPEVDFLVNNIDIWINPLANPDGTFAGGNNSVWGATRGNSNNIDLNRNYPDPEDGQHPDGNPWQTETVIWMDFAEDMDFVVSANMHGGAEVVNYPWDTWSTLHADDDWWIYVSREYADLVHENGWSGYLTDLDNGITNGYAWYTISGGRQDYMNYFQNCREVTLELSNIKTPPESQLDDFWDANYLALLAYMKQVTNGFSGTVVNAINGSGVPAKVTIVDHDNNNSEVYASLPTGHYQRPIKEGNYDVVFSALGYYDATFNINIVDDQDLELNVEMMPVGTLISNFTASANVAGEGSAIDFYDLSVGNNIVSWEWTFEGALTTTSNEQNPQGIIYPITGQFDVTLKVTNTDGDFDVKYIDDFIDIKEAVIIDNTSVTICDAVFYDTGAENSDYENDESYIITFYPENAGEKIILEFIDFDVENSWNCVNDYLQIFDGENINAPEIGQWCGTNGPGWIFAENETGALTVHFHSNSAVTQSGWKAVISCDSNVGIISTSAERLSVFPNPVSKVLNVVSEDVIESLVVTNLSGVVNMDVRPNANSYAVMTEDLIPGLYLLHVLTDGRFVTRKIVISN